MGVVALTMSGLRLSQIRRCSSRGTQCELGTCQHLPSAAACFLRMDLPVYPSFEVMRRQVLNAVEMCVSFQFV